MFLSFLVSAHSINLSVEANETAGKHHRLWDSKAHSDAVVVSHGNEIEVHKVSFKRCIQLFPWLP